MSAGAAQPTRNKDGIPLWDGDPSSYTEFAEAARLYEQSVEPHKRAQAGPRIAAELSGAARRYVIGQPADWLSYQGGVDRLLEHLRVGLGQPRIMEVTEHLNKYFKASRRKNGETINEYLARKNEIYLRAQQALQRVLPHQTAGKPKAETYRWENPAYGSTTWSRRTSIESQAEPTEDDPTDESTTTGGTNNYGWGDAAWGRGSQQGAWSSYDGWQNAWSWSGWSEWDWRSTWKPPTTSVLPELLPDFVQGWILLHDANLDQQERNLIQTAAGDNYSVASISQALRAQFPEGELRRRDQGRRHQGLLGDWEGDEGENGEDIPEVEFGMNAEEALTEEGFAIWSSAREDYASAMVQGDPDRLLLRQDHEMTPASRVWPVARSAIGQPTAQIPKASANAVLQEEAPFVMYVDTQEGESAWSSGPVTTTATAVEQGKCVIDSGATKSLGSTYALERLMACNIKAKGTAAVHGVDQHDRPTFGFGNSSSDRCLSTVTMALQAQGQPGQMKIHALDRGQGPVLLSIDALRRMGAQIDFANDLMVLGKLHKKRIIKLERSATGHQVMSLSDDLYKNSCEVDREVPMLSDFMPKPTDVLGDPPEQREGSQCPSVENSPRQKHGQSQTNELRERLEKLGESPPKRWTKIELLQRIEEITGENLGVLAKTKREESEYQRMVKDLNRASRLKADLVKFCQTELGYDPGYNLTIAQIKREAMLRVYDKALPDPTDAVGFGRHCSLSYEEVKSSHPQYCTWVVKTAQEGECDPRLRRLAGWLGNSPAEVSQARTEFQKNIVEKKGIQNKGYAEPPPSPRGATNKAAASVAASSASGSRVTVGSAQLQELLETMQYLKEEVSTLKEERPRKKGTIEDAESSSTQSYTMESYEMVPKIFEGLVAHERPALMEIACSPDSLLAATVQGMCQSEKAASRCAAWNDCDLSTAKGVALVMQRLQHERPRHVWLSPYCGPYSPLQNVNQRTAQQCDDLKQKRKAALKMYLGAVSVAHACWQMGIHFTWEWAEHSNAWRLPLMQRLIKKCNLYSAVVKGCRVNLRQAKDDRLKNGIVPRTPVKKSARTQPTGTNFVAEAWWSTVSDKAYGEESAFWASKDAAVEVEIPLPESKKGQQLMMSDMTAYLVSNLRRRAVEVSEKRLGEEERKAFGEAKAVEVRNFIAAEAFETIPPHMRPPKEAAIGMRWLLTWKVRDDGTVKPKARAILLGYQDPSYEHRATTAPVMTRLSRQLFLQLSANQSWKVWKGDVTGAFLQGRAYPDKLYCIPCDEVCDAMNIERGSVTRLRKACYGLVDAPLEWYRTISEFFETIGLERSWSDPCMWLWRPEGKLRGCISGHVDDFLFGGSEQDAGWQDILKQIRERFKWSEWEADRFVQCGVQIEQCKEGFKLSQSKYVETIKEIPLSSGRRREKHQETTDREKSQLRALLGAISWHAQQVAAHFSASVSLLLSEVAQSTVSTIMDANQLLNQVRAQKDHVLVIHKFPPEEELCMLAWVDASNQNRADGRSRQNKLGGLAFQQGVIVTDSRNVYDKLRTEVVTLKGAGHELSLFYKMGGQWRIVEDENMRKN
ncbi:RE2 [Symbiodinium sp. CCMP2592]|nr:RE2 [Symbiodinium sp. CCMP2592]